MAVCVAMAVTVCGAVAGRARGDWCQCALMYHDGQCAVFGIVLGQRRQIGHVFGL